MDNKYQNQAKLLTRCLSAVSRETCFALKGGTAINFFYSNLPRLSVDIDVTYIDFDERATAFKHIDNSLDSIAANLQKIGIKSRKDGNETKKLICWDQTAIIKIEPNYNIRGYIYKPEEMEVQEKTEREIGYSKVKVVSKAEVYGGKVCVALDRQHPRDLFDMFKFFEQDCFNEQIKNGIIVAFLDSVVTR